MGNQQSAEKEKATGRSGPGVEQKRVNRRTSIQALPVSRSRATPADPSSSNTNAVAYTTSHHVGKAPLQQYLNSPSPDSSSKNGKSLKSGSKPPPSDQKIDGDPKSRDTAPSVAIPQSSGPMNVPTARSKPDEFDEEPLFEKQELEEPRSPYHERRYTPMAQTRPPRLPLAIADVPRIPESPALQPVDKGNADVPIFETDDPLPVQEHHLRRQSSMVSTTTQDEDVDEELPPYDPSSQTVPTKIEWNQQGYKVYVTGTFANWERKYRLHHRKDGSGLAATINLPPGTHHLMFLVDDRMTTSPDLPTCVDFNNVLVNYIELATEDVVKQRRESNQTVTRHDSSQTVPTTDDKDGHHDTEDHSDQEMEPQAEEIPLSDFRQVIPSAYVDIDLAEDDSRYHQATRVIGDCQGPPSLPMFLSRSILNGILPVKDDGSVLGLPNHTVLNHLMTSSVKNGVLATSVTTRYKKKYVTTISFKPVPKFNQPRD